MAAGDVTAVILDLNIDEIESTIESLRVNANSKFLIASTGPEKQQVLIVHIEEAGA